MKALASGYEIAKQTRPTLRPQLNTKAFINRTTFFIAFGPNVWHRSTKVLDIKPPLQHMNKLQAEWNVQWVNKESCLDWAHWGAGSEGAALSHSDPSLFVSKWRPLVLLMLWQGGRRASKEPTASWRTVGRWTVRHRGPWCWARGVKREASAMDAHPWRGPS